MLPDSLFALSRPLSWKWHPSLALGLIFFARAETLLLESPPKTVILRESGGTTVPHWTMDGPLARTMTEREKVVPTKWDTL